MARETYISIITLDVNVLNAPAKRYRLAKWIQKQDPYICCLCLLVGAFIPFAFKIIIDIYVPIAIFLNVWG